MKSMLMSLAAIAVLTGAANAAPVVVTGEVVPTRHVSYADVNLGSQAGQAVVVRRIKSAATEVCARPGDRSLRAVQIVRNCYRDAVDGGLVQLDAILDGYRRGQDLAAAVLTIRPDSHEKSAASVGNGRGAIIPDSRFHVFLTPD